MHATTHGERTLSNLDHTRLSQLMSGGMLPPVLAELLATADVLPLRERPADVITLNSQVEIVDVHTRHRQLLTVCFPDDAEPSAGYISVLSPVGTGLLGLKVGEVARWPIPSGEEGSAEIVAVVQPGEDGSTAA